MTERVKHLDNGMTEWNRDRKGWMRESEKRLDDWMEKGIEMDRWKSKTA